jgi:hypothetical protein
MHQILAIIRIEKMWLFSIILKICCLLINSFWLEPKIWYNYGQYKRGTPRQFLKIGEREKCT